MVEKALRGVVRQAVEEVAEHGLTGAHHFYITFSTQHPGVSIPDYLYAQYPDTMNIVLQHQFWGLEANDEGLAVTLSFRKVQERLYVPWDAIVAFADPSVNFALQFEAIMADSAGATVHDRLTEADEPSESQAPSRPAGKAAPITQLPLGEKGERERGEEDEDTEKGAGKGADVVAIDAFRKK